MKDLFQMKLPKDALAKLEQFQYYDVEIKIPSAKCGCCDKITGDVELTVDPYVHDIYDKVHWKLMCQNCYTQACEDI